MEQNRYHVVLGMKSTTVTVDKTLSDLLALKLGHGPRSADAHSAVRAYLQGKLDEKNDAGRTSVSQWLREEALLDLVEKKLSDKYWRWFNIWFDATYRKKRR
ncbi:MAG: hypothetical protein ACXVCF_16795 [Isosphaeraceae bacterium]